MIEKIIENWLTKSSERSYQLPFCYLLMQEGKTVIHLTRHSAMEHGKDIIALDDKGTPHAYQLKGVNGGRFRLSDWQEIQGQIYQLIFTPCSHPSITSKEHHKSYLVVNGEIEEEVQHAIKMFNTDWENRGQPQYRLETKVKGQIIESAFKVKDSFIPTEIIDFKSLLEFYLEDGIDFLDKEKFNKLLISVSNKPIRNENEFKRIVTSSALLCSLASASYTNQNNHLAVVEAWTMYISNTLRLVEKHGYKFRDYKNEVEIANNFIVRSLLDLFDEIKNREDFFHGNPFTEAFVFRHRTTIILGMLAYLGTVSKEISYNDVDHLIQKHFSRIGIWGESALPYFISIFIFYLKHDKKQIAADLITQVVNLVMEGIINPEKAFHDIYTNVDDAISWQFSNNEKISPSPRTSYILKSLIIIMSQLELRNLLEKIWTEVSKCVFNEFKPDNLIDYYLWKVDEGELLTEEPPLTESWGNLLANSKLFDESRIPEGIKCFRSYTPLFLMVYPQRLNSNMLKWYLS